LNDDYIKSSHDRLNKKFEGFDSIDPRMERVPLDLRKKIIRDEYLENHIKWFLKNHEDAKEIFYQEVNKIYGDKILSQNHSNQEMLFK